jgi:ligand-binding sensor protein
VASLQRHDFFFRFFQCSRTSWRWQEIGTRFHREHPVSVERCRENDDHIRSHLGDGKRVAKRCKNGLWTVGIPILISDEHMATLFLGQFFYEDEQPDKGFFRRQAEELGLDSREYMRVLGEVPVFSRQ